MTTTETVIKIIAEEIGVDEKDIDMEATFYENDVDSLSVVNIIMTTERTLGFTLPDELMEATDSPKKFVEFIEGLNLN